MTDLDRYWQIFRHTLGELPIKSEELSTCSIQHQTPGTTGKLHWSPYIYFFGLSDLALLYTKLNLFQTTKNVQILTVFSDCSVTGKDLHHGSSFPLHPPPLIDGCSSGQTDNFNTGIMMLHIMWKSCISKMATFSELKGGKGVFIGLVTEHFWDSSII